VGCVERNDTFSLCTRQYVHVHQWVYVCVRACVLNAWVCGSVYDTKQLAQTIPDLQLVLHDTGLGELHARVRQSPFVGLPDVGASALTPHPPPPPPPPPHPTPTPTPTHAHPSSPPPPPPPPPTPRLHHPHPSPEPQGYRRRLVVATCPRACLAPCCTLRVCRDVLHIIPFVPSA
jgi:hypothetical protein